MLKWILFAAVLAVPALAQDGVTREELRRVPVPGSDTMEVVVIKLTVAPGARLPVHTHYGDEHTVVITPATAQTPNGQVIEFVAGQTLYFPSGQPHGGLTNLGEGPMEAITTSVVEVGKPLTTPAE